MSHEVEKMVFAGATPWHGLGTEIDDATTFWDAFKMAGLDWEVQTEPLFRGDAVRSRLRHPCANRITVFWVLLAHVGRHCRIVMHLRCLNRWLIPVT